MKYLLYCVFSGRRHENPVSVSGVDGEPVLQVHHKGLTAAISRITGDEPKLKMPQLLAFKEVVESLHEEFAVIPMRYGSLFEEEHEVIRFLEQNFDKYTELLKDLEGCVEMGLRIQFSQAASPAVQPEKRGSLVKMSGRAFLAARKEHYEEEEKVTSEVSALIDQCREALTGLYVKYRSENETVASPAASTQKHLLSLYFLVPQKFIESFREAFRNLRLKESVKILLSGPWPPYNFVSPTLKGRIHNGRKQSCP